MRSIIDTLKTGTGKDRLAIISDIVSILGVSLVAILSSALALKAKLHVENIIGILILAMISLAGAAVVVVLFLAALSRLSALFPAKSLSRLLMLIALWLLFGALFLYVAYFAYMILSSVQFVVELKPA